MLLLAGWAWGVVQAVTDEGRYIEVTGTLRGGNRTG